MDTIMQLGEQGQNFVFIVGSPRSGTTLLGEILDLHPNIGQWYEPYFVWDRFFRDAVDDVRTECDTTEKVVEYIRDNFEHYQNELGFNYLVDKSPRNSLKISFVRKIFPKAKFIHIVRDGRDVTLSINKEWTRRRKIVQGSKKTPRFHYIQALKVIYQWLDRQPLWLDRFRAMWFETRGQFWNKDRHLNRLRWNGETGWGPRFSDWERVYQMSSIRVFNAHQWSSCVEAILQDFQCLPSEQKFTIHYEHLLQQPLEVVTTILNFIGTEIPTNFEDSLPVIKENNFDKWRNGFTSQEIEELKPALTPMLTELGYLEKWPW